jgi:hypothetical protein
MKIEVHRKEAVEEITFPVLMECISKDDPDCCMVVLFNSLISGMVMYSKTSGHKVGEYITTWVDANRTSTWRKFVGEISIEN